MKINRLTDRNYFVGTLTDNDLLHIVDVSDTSQYPAGSSYKLKLLDLKSYLNTGLSGYLTKTAADSYYVQLVNVGQPFGVAPLNGSGLIDSAYLPSYVDDVLDFPNFASFPITGETGKIYIADDTNRQYRWTGSAYVDITGFVDSVNGKTGAVVLTTTDIAEGTSLYFTNARAVTALTGQNISIFTNDAGYLTSASLSGYVPYTGATTSVDLGANNLNAQAIHIKGTGGNGHLGLKFQSVTPTTSANESSLFADVNGDLGWQNDNHFLTKFISSGNTANRSYTLPDRNITFDNITTSTTTNGTGFLKGNGTSIIFDNSTYLIANQNITVSGDATGSGSTSIALTLATVNANIGTFNNVTVNAKGLVTAASNVAYLTSAITSLNGLTGATQTFTNDTNVTITSAGTAHALGWSGQLSVARGGTGLSTFGGTNTLLYTSTANNLTSSTSLTFDGTNFKVGSTAAQITGLTSLVKDNNAFTYMLTLNNNSTGTSAANFMAISESTTFTSLIGKYNTNNTSTINGVTMAGYFGIFNNDATIGNRPILLMGSPVQVWAGGSGTTSNAGFRVDPAGIKTGIISNLTSGATSTNHFTGSVAYSYVAKTASYSITSTDFLVDCTTGTFTVTLPTAVGCQGRVYVVINSGSGTITVNTTSSQTINGNTSITINLYTCVWVMSNGSNWIII